MSQPQSTPFRKEKNRRRLLAVLGGLLAATLVMIGISQTNGTPRQNVVVSDPSVWAVRSGSTSYYGSVNTAIAELASVHSGNPTDFQIAGVLQDEDGNAVLYSTQSILPLNPAKPADIEAGQKLADKPLGADIVESAGPWALFLNRSTGSLGAVTIKNLANGAEVTAINQSTGKDAEDTEKFAAATITRDGLVYAVTADGQAITHDISTGERSALASGIDVPDSALDARMSVFAENHWAALFRTDNASTLWLDGSRHQSALTGVASLAKTNPAAASLAVADQSGLVLLSAEGTETARESSDMIAGTTPAAPMWNGDCVYGAWSNGSSMFASACSGDIAQLDFPENAAGTTGDPVFRGYGESIILNDGGNGVVWLVENHEFRLVASSALWQQDALQTNTNNAKQNQDAKSNECPVPASGAQAEFGVRPGQATNIPVLVSAQDPNPGDTISIVPSDASPSWSAEGIGTLSLSNNNQAISLVPTTATGTATFGYTITDGLGDCAVAATASVAVHPDEVRTAPEYRATQSDSLGHLQVSRGGSLRFDGLAGWVDPDGDPIYVSSVTASSGTAAFTPTGTVAYRADDDQEPGRVTLTVNVTDGHGDGTASHNFTVTVSDNPTLFARSFSRSVPAGTTATIDLSEHISGIALGDVRTARAEITSASIENEARRSEISIQTNTDEMSLTVTPAAEGVYPIVYKVESGTSSATGTVLVNSHKTNTTLSSPPLTAFIRPSEDVTIDPLELVTNPSGKLLMVADIQTAPVESGALAASAIGGSELRVSGQTPTGQPGRVGIVNYTVTDGEQTAPGQVAVFELDEATSTKPVTITDQVTVRAGAQIDIPVLANDIAAGGTTLALDPSRIVDNETGFAFPSDTKLRYLAPAEPGYYTLFYSAHAIGHSDVQTEGQVNVHVTPPGDNRAPTAKTIDARVDAGDSTIVDIPAVGIDPDGDDTYITSVTQPAENGSAQLLSDGRIMVTSTSGTGPIEFTYTIQDSHGSTSTANARVGVLENSDRAPVAYNDQVEVKPGSGTVALDPTSNDHAVGTDRLVVEKVEAQPTGIGFGDNVQGTQDLPKAEIGENNVVTLDAPEGTGKLVYRYTVASVSEDGTNGDNPGSKAEGIIIVTATEQALPIYPIVRDTLIGTNDISGESFTTDVLAEKTVWSGGDLRTALRGTPAGVSLSGSNLSGSVSENRQTIVFSATGTADGEDLTTYGFVKVPQLENILPELFDPSKTYEVDQGESVAIDLDQDIRPFGGRSLKVNATSTSGSRDGASCTASGTRLTYSAGDDGTVVSDACHIEVQWDGYDKSATQLSIPIRVILDEAPATIASQQIAVVDPGQSATYDLRNAVTWPDKNLDDLVFACGPASGATGLAIACDGPTVTMQADDTAQQGATSTFDVSIVSPSFSSGEPQARMSVQVGTLAPMQLNATGVSLTINAGESQSATTEDLVALNASLPHYGDLSLVPGSASFPAGFDASINGNSVTVTAQSAAAGGQYSGSVQIQDSQNNTGTIPITIAYNARPNPPQVSVASVGDGVVSLTVRDNAQASVPAVTGFTVSWSGEGGSGSKDCSQGSCEITGLQNYKAISISATAQNAQGSSDASDGGSTYAYASPAAPTITFDGPGTTVGTAIVTVTPGATGADQILVYMNGRAVKDMPTGGSAELPVNVYGQRNAVPVYAEARVSVGPPATLNQSVSQTAVSNTVRAYSLNKPELGALSAQVSGSAIQASVPSLVSGGDGIEWFWTVNGQQYGATQTSEGAQSITFPASALRQNEENVVGIKAYTLYQGQRVGDWASEAMEVNQNLRPISFPADANGVTYSFDHQAADSTYQLSNDQRQIGGITFRAETIAKPASGSCTATVRWIFTEGGTTYIDPAGSTFQIGPASGSPCYAVNVDHGFFHDEDLSIYNTTDYEWVNPTAIGLRRLPKNTDDYTVKLEVSANSAFPPEATYEIPLASNGDGVATWQTYRFDPSNASYAAKLTIDFKNQLEGITDIQLVRTIRIVAP